MYKNEKVALLIIDMVKDNFDEIKQLPITTFAKQIIYPINQLIDNLRSMGGLIVFSTDSFQKDDFIFTGRMKPHSLTGTEGAEIIDELNRKKEDFWLPKPRFSAFFNTPLAQWLHERGVTLCAVAGIATNFCVMTTAMDAICHDFKVVILEDCTAAFSESIHEQSLAIYRHNPLMPLFKVATSAAMIEGLNVGT